MISKKIDRHKGTSSYERLGRYMVNAENNEATVMWTRTAEYVVDEKLNSDGEKVLWYQITHCDAEVPAMAIAEVELTQSRNTRSKADKTMHLVVSFPEGEFPTREQIADIENEMCKALGYEEHQRISAVHQDTDNMHLHIAINKVHPATFNLHEPYRDYYIRDRVCREMERKHGLTVDNGIGQGQRYGREQAQQTHGQQETLWNWVQENAKPSLVKAAQTVETWQDLHEAFADYGLQIKPRGAGLVVGTLDGSVHIKASSIDRSLSIKPLVERLGAYESPRQSQEQVQKPKTRYEGGLKLPDGEARMLYEAFRLEKSKTLQDRQAFRARQKAERNAFNASIREWHQGERRKIRESRLTAAAKREAYQALSDARRWQWEKHRVTQAEQRKFVYDADKPKTWEDYLVRSAESGNIKALELLRRRKHRQERLAKALLTADNYDAAKVIVYDHLKPYARKNGELVYRVQDGGSVTDERTRVRVDDVTAGAAFLALTMAAERFEGQRLDVQGEEAFKSQVVQFAVQYGMGVTFKDSALEAERQRLSQERENKSISPALAAFINQRNLIRGKVADVLSHRVWTPDDSNDLIYQGRRNLVDGSQAILLQKDDQMLVKPVQPEEFKNLKVGQAIVLDKTGQLVPGKGRTHER